MAPFELPPEVYVSQGVLGAVHTVSEMKIFDLRPHFFKFVVYRHIWSLFNVWIRNKTKNKISVMSDMGRWSMRLSSKRRPTHTHTYLENNCSR